MKPGLDKLRGGKDVFMVIRFTGEVKKEEAIKFNGELHDLLATFNRATAGRAYGRVVAGSAQRVTVTV